MALRALLAAIALLVAAMATHTVAAGAAGGGTLTATVDTATPEQNMPVSVTFSGTAVAGTDSTLDAVTRPAKGPACGTSFASDQADAPGSDVFIDALDVPAGSYTHTNAFTPTSAGHWVVCAWLEQTTGGVTSVTAASSTAVTVRSPQVAQLTVTPPATMTAQQPFAVQYTTQTDQPLALYSVIHTPKVACAPSFESDRAASPAEAVVINGTSVNGGPATAPGVITSTAGSFQLCTWLEVAGNQGVASGPVSTPFTVAAVPGPPKVSPQLTLTGLSVSGGTVTFAGTTTTSYSGTVALTVQCVRQVGKGQVTVGGGAFSGSLTMPPACTPGVAVVVTATIAPSATFRGQTITLAGVIPAAGTSTTTNPGSTTKPGSTPTHTKTTRLPRILVSSGRAGGTTTNALRVKPHTLRVSAALGTLHVAKWTVWTRRAARAMGTEVQANSRHRVAIALGTPVHQRFACMALTRTVKGHKHTLRLALAVGPHRQLQWVRATTLARHARQLHLTPVASRRACL